MNFPDFLRSIWTDPRFQELALLYAAVSQVDMAGWWAPNSRLLALEIPGADLATARRLLEPWVQVHPTGYWSVKGYVAVQAGGDGTLKLGSPFHKGLDRVLRVHLKREVAAGASPDTIEGLGASPTGGVDLQVLPKVEAPVVLERGTAGAVSPKPQAPSPQAPSPKPQVQPGGQGDATDPTERGWTDVLNVFQQFAPLAVLDVKPWDRDAVKAAAARCSWPAVYGAAGAYFTHGPGPLPSLGDFLSKLPRLLTRACQHPAESKEWWEFAVDKTWPKGVHRKRWPDGCGHTRKAQEVAA